MHRRLRVSEAQYRLLADHSSDILMQLTVDARIRYVSPSIRQLGGYDPAQLVGTNAGELIAPQYREIIRAMHAATMREPGTTHCFDYEAMTADGTLRWFERTLAQSSMKRAILTARSASAAGSLKSAPKAWSRR